MSFLEASSTAARASSERFTSTDVSMLWRSACSFCMLLQDELYLRRLPCASAFRLPPSGFRV